jgi:hypothetical protein
MKNSLEIVWENVRFCPFLGLSLHVFGATDENNENSFKKIYAHVEVRIVYIPNTQQKH